MTETTYSHEDTDPGCPPDIRYGPCAAVFIEVECENGLCILLIRGRFATGADLDYLNSKLDQVRRLRTARVLADFSEVASIGSTGVGFLVSLYRMVTREAGGRLVLAGANTLVRQALKITGLSKIIPLADSFHSGLTLLSR